MTVSSHARHPYIGRLQILPAVGVICLRFGEVHHSPKGSRECMVNVSKSYRESPIEDADFLRRTCYHRSRDFVKPAEILLVLG